MTLLHGRRNGMRAHLFHLPEELLIQILEWCPPREVVTLERTCRWLNALVNINGHRLEHFEDKTLEFTWKNKTVRVKSEHPHALNVAFNFEPWPSCSMPESSKTVFEMSDESAIVFSTGKQLLMPSEDDMVMTDERTLLFNCGFVLSTEEEEMETDVIDPADLYSNNSFNTSSAFPAVLMILRKMSRKMIADTLFVKGLTDAEILEMIPSLPQGISFLHIVGDYEEKVILTLLTALKDEIRSLKVERTKPLSSWFMRSQEVVQLEELKLNTVPLIELNDASLTILSAVEMNFTAPQITKLGLAKVFDQWAKGERDIEYIAITFGNADRRLPVDVLLDIVTSSASPVRPGRWRNGARMEREDGDKLELIIYHQGRDQLTVECQQVLAFEELD